MKKIFLTILLGCLCCSFCFAQTSPSQTKGLTGLSTKKVSKKAETGMFLEGTVESTTVADIQKGTKSEITVTDGSGKKHNFLVKSTTTIYDPASASGVLANIKKDDKVKIKYSTTPEGVNEAISITNLTK